LGVVLDTFKPQAGGFAIVAELAKKKTFKEQFSLLLPLIILLVISIPLLPSWIYWMFAIGNTNNGIRNFSLFPYTIPIGLISLWFTWRRKDPIWGCVASLALSPYFYIHSAMPLVFLLAEKNWKWGLAANLAIWGLIFLIILGYVPVKL
jgi:hypothetical protein